MEKLKINFSDCVKIADTVFALPVAVWVNCAPKTPCVEILEFSDNMGYDFTDRDVDLTDMPDWMQDMYREEWRIRDVFDGWKKCFQVEKAPSHESFNWMEDFVNNVIEPKDRKAALKMARALGGRGTFYRFKNAVAETPYLADWYKYLNHRQGEYVAQQFREAGIEVVDKGGMPVISNIES